MARIIKNEDDWHLITVKGDRGGSVVLVGPPSRCYLSCHGETEGIGVGHVSVSGNALRKMALAIVKATNPKRR